MMMLDKVVVILDPMQNPDGRDRFVNFHREGRGVAPDPEPLAAERVQRWATGRHNHYLFDMNRDWFLQTQLETRTKIAAYLRWQPHVTVDAHEMGANSEYYFDPRDLLVSGFCWPQTLELMAGKPLVLYQSLGKGHIVGFADDPNYRAMTPTSQKFFLNAVFFGPGH